MFFGVHWQIKRAVIERIRKVAKREGSFIIGSEANCMRLNFDHAKHQMYLVLNIYAEMHLIKVQRRKEQKKGLRGMGWLSWIKGKERKENALTRMGHFMQDFKGTYKFCSPLNFLIRKRGELDGGGTFFSSISTENNLAGSGQ